MVLIFLPLTGMETFLSMRDASTLRRGSFNFFTPHGDGNRNDGAVIRHYNRVCFNFFTPHGDGNCSSRLLSFNAKRGFNSLTPHGDGNFFNIF